MIAAVGIFLIIFYIIIGLVGLAAVVALIIGKWKTLEKAGKPGWPAIVPIYGDYVLIEVAGIKWWFILIICGGFLIPGIGALASAAALFCVNYNIAKKFGYDPVGYGIGLTLLAPVFFAIIGFSKATYTNVEVSGYGPIPESKPTANQNAASSTNQNAAASSTSNSNFCKYCGSKLEANAKFCPNCGKEIH